MGTEPVRRVVEAVSIPFVAISAATLADVRRLKDAGAAAAVVVGTALYES